MNETKQIEIKRYPKIVEEFANENFNLKMLSAALLIALTVALLLLLYLFKQGPMVIALGENGQIAKLETKITDLQIEAAVREYLNFRYNWDEKTIREQLQKAQFFVVPAMVPAFQKSMQDVQKFVHEKKVSQRVYPQSVAVDLKEKRVVVVADRITEFDALKAATELRLNLTFTVDDRSIANPWGIFITKESEGVKP